MNEGVVKPLPTHVFDKDEVEEAFRFTAKGEHIGKVMIKVKYDIKFLTLWCWNFIARFL